MASFPFQFEANFEGGDASEFTSTVGTQVAVEHYKELARNGAWGVPYRGAYALQGTFGTNTDSYVRSTSITIGSGSVGYSRFMFYIGDDVSASTTTEVLLHTTEPAVAGIGLRIESGGDIKFGIASNGSALTTSDVVLEKGRWYTAELTADTTNTNTCTATLNDAVSVTIANGVATGATTESRLGVVGIGAGSLANIEGTVTLDELATDTARLYGFDSRYPQRLLVTKDSHIFVGSGNIEDVQLIAGAGTDCELNIYDTETGDTNPQNLVYRHTNNTTDEATNYNGRNKIKLHKGAYVTMSGTDPRAVIALGVTSSYGSEANVRKLARG